MWIFGEFGVLMPANRPAKYTPPGEKRTMQIRSRRAKDLDILRALYMQGTLGETIHTPDKDYEYRAYCEPEHFAQAVAAMVMDIHNQGWTKFKPQTLKYADHELHGFYNSVWSMMFNKFSTPQHKREYWYSSTSKNTPSSVSSFASGTPTLVGPSFKSPTKSTTDRIDELLAGTPYEDPDFGGFSTLDTLSTWPADAKDDLEFLDDLDADTTEAVLSARDVAECLKTSVKSARRFLRSAGDQWKAASGRYEVPVDAMENLARQFYAWQDKQK